MTRWMVAAAAFPLLCSLLDDLQRWAQKSYRREMPEGGLYPFSKCPIGWFRVTHRNPELDHDLWVIRLPSFQWRYIGWGDRYGWTQLALIKRGAFARREIHAGSPWRAIHLVCETFA